MTKVKVKGHEQKAWYKVQGHRYNDPIFSTLSWSERGMYHSLEQFSTLMDERFIIESFGENLTKFCGKLLKILPSRCEDFFKKLHRVGLVEYNEAENTIWFKYTEEMQEPLTGAERVKLHRERKKVTKCNEPLQVECNALDKTRLDYKKTESTDLWTAPIEDEIIALADTLVETNRFPDAHQFYRKQKKARKEPESVLEAFSALIRVNPTDIKTNAWNYCQGIVNKTSPTIREQKHHAESKALAYTRGEAATVMDKLGVRIKPMG